MWACIPTDTQAQVRSCQVNTLQRLHTAALQNQYYSVLFICPTPALPPYLSWLQALYPLLLFSDLRDRLFISWHFFPYVLVSWVITSLVWISLVFSDLKNIFSSVSILLKTLLSTERTASPINWGGSGHWTHCVTSDVTLFVNRHLFSNRCLVLLNLVLVF